MNYNTHLKLKDKHAFLSPSKASWIRYDESKLVESWFKHKDAAKGTELHKLAELLINNNQKLPDIDKTMNLYVNDAIGYKMKTEVILYYSDNCFGSADALSFRKNVLRIHDLKTGTGPCKMDQLLIYAALFCLEYKLKPNEIKIELRIYQNNEVVELIPTIEDILPVMDTIVRFDKIIEEYKGDDD